MKLFVICVFSLVWHLWSQGNPPASPDDFTRVEVATGLNIPMALKEGPDNMLYVIQQTGEIYRIDPSNGDKTLLIKLGVYHYNEIGGLGIVPDPDFLNNNYIYVYYTPTNVLGKISRFTVANDKIEMSSESVMMSFTVGIGGHMAGKMLFDKNGLLYVATGANDGPKANVNGWQTAANTNDLRGKILRVKPTPDGGYTIPTGNLYPEGTARTQPEIYSMGHRNPFGIGMDMKTDELFVGEVGGAWEELNRVTQAGNFGWPKTEGNTSGGSMSNPLSNNPGLTDLPEINTSWLSYQRNGTTVPNFSFSSSLNTACLVSGPVYHAPALAGKLGSLPDYYDNNLFFFDCYEGKFFAVEKEAGVIQTVEQVFQGLNWITGGARCCVGDSIVATGTEGVYTDMQITASGHVYVLEYYTGKLVRVDYTPGGSIVPINKFDGDSKLTSSPQVEILSQGDILFSLVGNSGERVHFEVFDMLGNRIKSIPGVFVGSKWTGKLSHSEKFNGLHFVKVLSNTQNFIQRVVW